jgi:hypothetical protein
VRKPASRIATLPGSEPHYVKSQLQRRAQPGHAYSAATDKDSAP